MLSSALVAVSSASNKGWGFFLAFSFVVSMFMKTLFITFHSTGQIELWLSFCLSSFLST